MIADFRCKDTKALFDGEIPATFPHSPQSPYASSICSTRRNALKISAFHPRTDWNNSRVIELVSIAYVSTPNGVSALSGQTARHTVSKLLIITRRIPCASAHIREKSCWKNS